MYYIILIHKSWTLPLEVQRYRADLRTEVWRSSETTPCTQHISTSTMHHNASKMSKWRIQRHKAAFVGRRSPMFEPQIPQAEVAL